MKNGKWIGAILFLVLTIAIFSVMAGCIQDEAKIEGTVHNNRDERSVVNVFGMDGSLTAQNAVERNSMERWELYPGRYTITAQGNDGVEFGEIDFTLSATDSSFTIIVYEDSLSATSG